jgi:hypothetical protein
MVVEQATDKSAGRLSHLLVRVAIVAVTSFIRSVELDRLS